MKKLLLIFGIFIFIIFSFGVLILFFDDEEVSNYSYEENVGDSTYTLMIYMCGSDLETDDGSATADITEMLKAKIDSKVNVLLETGGTLEWQEYNINNNQIYKIENNKLNIVKDKISNKTMTDPSNLSDFIDFCVKNYPAERYSLILWDHGGGSVSGFGYDELSKIEDESITIDEFKTVLESKNISFDFVGFDACLMANIETAYSLKNKVKYLIASEETEPGTGWEYTSLLNKLCSNTSADTVELGKVIINEFIKSNNTILDFDDATLSIIDLSKIDLLYNSVLEFVKEIKKEQLDTNNFASLSKIIASTKSYGEGEVDSIDLVNLAQRVNNSKSQDVINNVNNAVTYYKNTDSVKNSSGLSIYWPYNDVNYFDRMIDIYKKIGISSEYINVLSEFANIMVGGKNNSYQINSHTYNLNENYSNYSWYDQNIINDYEDYYDDYSYDEDLEITKVGDNYILELSDEDWEVINYITCEVLYDDEEGYVDLGSDDYFELDEDDNLIIDFDCSWISINGYIVPYYAVQDDEKYIGKVPAYLNDELVNLVIVWNEDDAKVVGAEPTELYGNTTLNYKGYKKIKKGDKIEFLFDYYTYDGEYEDSYIIYDPLYVDDNGLTVSYEEIEDGNFYVYYKITDIYNNTYYTNAITIY